MSFTQAMIIGASGTTVDTTSKNQLMVDTRAAALFANQSGNAYSALVDVTVATTDDDFFYLKNNDSRPLIIYKIEGWCDDAEQEISVILGASDDGTGAGDAIVPANLNSAYGAAASVDCASDATDLAITGGIAVDLLKFHNTALTLGSWDYPGGLILGPGGRLHMEAALAGLVNLTVFFYFADY